MIRCVKPAENATVKSFQQSAFFIEEFDDFMLLDRTVNRTILTVAGVDVSVS